MSSTPVVPNPKENLFDFAWIPPRGPDVPANKGYESRLKELADRAQSEAWSFEPAQPFAVLSNYLKYTFKRVSHEGKVQEARDAAGVRIAVFNTGLFTPNYEAIYAFFEANRDPARQPWVLADFLVESDRRLSFLLTPQAS
ncbi:MAG: DUF3825 domain-containing protein [Gemmatimonadetes bacterium]|nr:DUF3825 domain-containing protein [Gemmatimonadota bacterium]